MTFGMRGQIQLDPENFRPKEDDEEYFQKIYSDFEQRKLISTAPHAVDYADVFYWPYEWMVAVQTEVWKTVSWHVQKESCSPFL